LKNLKNTFFPIFSRWIKAYPPAIALVQWGKVFSKKHCEEAGMRANRVLVAKGWCLGIDGCQQSGDCVPVAAGGAAFAERVVRGVGVLGVRGARAAGPGMTGCCFTSMPWTGLRLYSSVVDSLHKNRSNFEKFEKKTLFRGFFSREIKAKRIPNRIVCSHDFSQKHCDECGYVRQSGTAPVKTVPVLRNLKKNPGFCDFSRCVKAKRVINRIVCRGDFSKKHCAGCGYVRQSGTAPSKTVPVLRNLKKSHNFCGFFTLN
jgi:hypothetical protein